MRNKNKIIYIIKIACAVALSIMLIYLCCFAFIKHNNDIDYTANRKYMFNEIFIPIMNNYYKCKGKYPNTNNSLSTGIMYISEADVVCFSANPYPLGCYLNTEQNGKSCEIIIKENNDRHYWEYILTGDKKGCNYPQWVLCESSMDPSENVILNYSELFDENNIINDKQLATYCARNPFINQIDIFAGNSISSLSPLKYIEKLERLTLWSCNNIMNLDNYLSSNNSIKSICIISYKFNIIVSKLPASLENLSLINCNYITFDEDVKKLCSLKSMSMAMSKNIQGIKYLSSIINLKEINISLMDSCDAIKLMPSIDGVVVHR